MRGAYIVRITPDDVGERVSVRVRRPDAAPTEPSTTDVLGHIRSWTDGLIAIERKDGTVVEVAADDLLAARVVPPAPVRHPRRA